MRNTFFQTLDKRDSLDLWVHLEKTTFFMFLVPYCHVIYDVHIKRRLIRIYLKVLCMKARVLFMLFVLACAVLSNMVCVL